MKQNYLFKTLFLLCALLVGMSVSAADKWVKTDPADLATGDVVVIVDQTSSMAMSNDQGTSKAPVATAVTLSADKSEISGDVAENLQLVVTVNNGSYKFGVADTENFVYCTNSNNGVRVGTNENNAFTIYDNNGVDFLVNTATSRYIGVYNSQDWRCYTSINTNIKECVTAFYKKEASDPSDQSVATTVTIDASGITNTNVFVGTAAGKLVATVSAGESAVEDATVTWTSDNEEVATIDAAGVVTLVAAGTAKLTASYAGVENQYKASSKAYTLTVTNSDPNGPGTENNPYTVAQAIANTPASGNSDEVYIKGIVSSFYKDDIVSDNANYRYYISDDGETTTQLLVYKGTGLNKAAFEKADDLLVGDVVVICGKLTTYSNAPEVAAGNYIVSLTRPDAPVDERQAVEMSFPEASYEVTLGEDFTAPVLTITEGYDGTVAYISSDETVAKVAADGAVTILAAGTTTITATAPATDNYKSATASYKLTVNAGEEPTPELSDDLFSLVTDVTVLKANDKILFVNSEASVALSTEQKSNNRGQAEVTITESNQIEGVSANVQVITLEGESGAWYFKVGDGYLYAASSKSNYLRTEAEKDDNAKATIAIDETNATITFQGENTRNVLMYNASSSLFSCYASTSTQAPVQLYVKTGTTGIQTVNHTNVADGAYFNLAGQRVAAPAKGLYIVNGKKVVLK
ncbi:MAG: Ig-like domain-containing protein [Prevotella sp.]|nr:Ig-like domain-containing protein [Prevotella sp.]MBQ8488030.1 Ig-like domain-containing protein [Prevotella sp.]